MTYISENPTRLPRIGEPIRELKNGRWVLVGKVKKIRRVKGRFEVVVR